MTRTSIGLISPTVVLMSLAYAEVRDSSWLIHPLYWTAVVFVVMTGSLIAFPSLPYGRKRGYGFGRSLAAAVPVLILKLVAAVVTAEPLELPWVIIGVSANFLPPCVAHWLASYLGSKTVPARRQ